MASAVITEPRSQNAASGLDAGPPVLDFQQRITQLLARSKSTHGPAGQTLIPDAGSEPLFGGSGGFQPSRGAAGIADFQSASDVGVASSRPEQVRASSLQVLGGGAVPAAFLGSGGFQPSVGGAGFQPSEVARRVDVPIDHGSVATPPSRLPEADSSQGARLCEPPEMNQGLEGRRDVGEEEERTKVSALQDCSARVLACIGESEPSEVNQGRRAVGKEEMRTRVSALRDCSARVLACMGESEPPEMNQGLEGQRDAAQQRTRVSTLQQEGRRGHPHSLSLPRAAVTEILSANASTVDPAGDDGALALLVPMIRRITREGRTVALVDHNLGLHPPGLAACGVDMRHLLILRPTRRTDALWAAETCARSPSIALTVLPASRLRDLDVRRLSLAAGEGQGVLVLLRPAREEGLSAPCALRLRVTRRVVGSGGWRVDVPIDHMGSGGWRVDAPIDHVGSGGFQPSRSAATSPSRLPEADSSQGARLCEPPEMNQGLEGRRDAGEQSWAATPHPPTTTFRLEVLRSRGALTPPPITIGVNHESPLDLHLAALPEHRPDRTRVAASGA